MKSSSAIALMSIPLLVTFLTPCSWAALGGDIASVEQDRMQMKATVPAKIVAEKYTVHEMTLETGTTVREYATSMGTIFAVTWRGQRIPDLQQLMGSYFDTFTNAAKSQQSQRSHLTIRQDDLVVRSGGHMRAYVGSAYAPKLMPSGITEADIK